VQSTGLDVRKKLRISNDTILIGFISRLIPAKNPHPVAIAAHELRNRGYDARAMFVGDGPATKYDNCIYIPRVEAIGDYLAAMSCFMLPSDSEAFSLAITEAWIAKVPVIATPVGAIKELEEKHGPMVVRLGTSLTDSVLLAISDGNRSTVQRAYDISMRNFTKEAMISRWDAYFNELTKAERIVSVAK
jgi:glycosyltransferase involved in cell wall biosynthesis